MSSDGRLAAEAFQSARNGGTRCPLLGSSAVSITSHREAMAISEQVQDAVASRFDPVAVGCDLPLHFPNNRRTHTDDCWTTEHR